MNRSLKKLLIPILASQPLDNLARQILPVSVPIFMLHRTSNHRSDNSNTTASHLRNCLSYLRHKGYHFLSLQQLIEHYHHADRLPPKSVVFTMDDGYADQADIIAPVFAEFECPLTFFVITGMLGNQQWPWDAKIAWLFEQIQLSQIQSSHVLHELGIDTTRFSDILPLRRATQLAMKQLPVEQLESIIARLANEFGVHLPTDVPQNYRAMSWQRARELEQQGITFAPHSVSHGILANMDESSMLEQINESWRTINQQLKQPLKVFCYPNGRASDFGERDIRALQETGYIAAVSTIADHVRFDTSPNALYHLPRLPLPDSFDDFRQYCSWVENARGKLA